MSKPEVKPVAAAAKEATKPAQQQVPPHLVHRAVLDVVVKQREDALNAHATAMAQANIAAADNDALRARVAELEARVAELTPKQEPKPEGNTDGNGTEVADGAGQGTAAAEPGHA